MQRNTEKKQKIERKEEVKSFNSSPMTAKFKINMKPEIAKLNP